VRQNARRRNQNRAQRSALRTQIKKMRQAIDESGAAVPKELMVETQRALDQAAAKGLVHKNKISRLKSRLAKAAARAQSA
jgi:small subunit ribosomal protein S20